MVAAFADDTVVCRPDDDTRISRPSESKKSAESVPDFCVSGPHLAGFVEDTFRRMRSGGTPHLALVEALQHLEG